MAKICIARVDRIGDLILSLPCETLWRQLRPRDQVEWLVHDNLGFLVKNVSLPLAADFVKTPEKNFISELRAGVALGRRLRAKNFEKVIALHVPWWVALAFWLAQIETRVGVASQWFSFLFFNRRLRQKRSRALKHESEYNFDLIKFALQDSVVLRGGAPDSGAPSKLDPRSRVTSPDFLPSVAPTQLVAPTEQVEKMKALLLSKGARLDQLFIIHAGMAGSARNWPPHFYRDLASRLLEGGASVVITGSRVDRAFIEKTTMSHLPGIIDLVEKTQGDEILALLSLASAVIVPSTGAAHMAASLGVHVVGIYSPVRVQAPLRWAPRGAHVDVKVPRVECPGILNCLGSACPHFDCMEQITVESIFACAMDVPL